MASVKLDEAMEYINSMPPDVIMTAEHIGRIIEMMSGCKNCYVPDKDRP